jgi:L-ascorbate metabolism protein UlaG (beta-lactamase superfamily)
MNISSFLKKIEWLKSNHPYGSACIRINSNQIIYIDPASISENNLQIKADLILLTHSHDDHFSIPTLRCLVKQDTNIICTVDCEEQLEKIFPSIHIYHAKPGMTKTINSIKIEAVPAYSIAGHPRSAGWVGYIIEVSGFRIYHSGDSGLTPEMKQIRNIDIAFLTVRSPYMMSPNELIQALEDINPKLAIPIHWIEAEKEDIDYILQNNPDTHKIEILEMK